MVIRKLKERFTMVKKIELNYGKIIVIALLIIVISIVASIYIYAATSDRITLTIQSDNINNCVNLNWDVSNNHTSNYTYKVFANGRDNSEFETVGIMDYSGIQKVKVLNVYPNAGNVLKTWMETNGYGMGIIQVTPVSISEFNQNPGGYLKSNENWNYDVIMFGTWDGNNGCDLNASSRDLTQQFIESGRGAIFGHDTIGMSGGWLTHPYFTSLAKYVNITMGASWSVDSGNNQVVITKKGIFTSFPWNIGEIGDVLNIPWSHHLDQYANGDIWLKFKDRAQDNFYLTSWNNCAMIQTGHSNAEATDDEQKIIANLIFYTQQITTGNSGVDHSGMDVAPPDQVKNVRTEFDYNDDLIVSFDEVEDNGSTYSYYVQGTNKTTSETINSDTLSTEVKTGIKGYVYQVDGNETIDPEILKAKTAITETTFKVSGIDEKQESYLHVASIDKANNISEVATIKLKYTFKINLEVTGNSNKDIKISNATIKVNVKDGDNIILDDIVTTNEYGIGKTNCELLLNKTLNCAIEVLTAPEPYENKVPKNLIIQIDENGNISATDTDNNEVTNYTEKKIDVKLVTNDTTAPDITIDPQTKVVQNDDMNITVTLKDEESGLKNYKYVITDSPNPLSEEEWNNATEVNN